MWPRGIRRHATDATRFIRALVAEFGATDLGRRAGVNTRTVYRWRDGDDWPSAERLAAIVESICPPSGSLPLYSAGMAIDGGTRVAGVGEYSIRAARGEPCHTEDWT